MAAYVMNMIILSPFQKAGNLLSLIVNFSNNASIDTRATRTTIVKNWNLTVVKGDLLIVN